MTGVPVAQLRAMIRLLWPAEITPTAKRQLEALCEQTETSETKGGLVPVAPDETKRPDSVTNSKET